VLRQANRREAAEAGFYKSPHVEGTFPRIQILTVQQLLKGEQIAYPRLLDVTFKQAPSAPCVARLARIQAWPCHRIARYGNL
jgi:hypothetical protein